MKLGDYLEREGLTRAAFASRIGVTHATIVRYITGDRSPSIATIEKISDVTGGRVGPHDFFGATKRRAA